MALARGHIAPRRISRDSKRMEVRYAYCFHIFVAPRIGEIACDLMGWDDGARLGQDDLLWKPPGGSEVAYHQDGDYISNQFEPRENNSVTVWLALDDCDEETGVVEYVEGSHLWPDDGGDGSATSADFHGSSDYQAALKRAAARAGIDESAIPTPTRVPVKAGDAIFHHQAVWHGSARNASTHRPRRALGVHLVRKDVEWRRDRHPDYIYGR